MAWFSYISDGRKGGFMKAMKTFKPFIYLILLSLTLVSGCWQKSPQNENRIPVKKVTRIKPQNKAVQPSLPPVQEPSIIPLVTPDSLQFVSDTIQTDTIRRSVEQIRKLDSKYFKKSFNLHKKPFIA